MADLDLADLRAAIDSLSRLGPLKADVDYFGYDDEQIVACILNDGRPQIDLLITIDTGVAPTGEDCWKRARETQEYRDAVAIVALVNAAPALLARCEAAEARVADLERDLADKDTAMVLAQRAAERRGARAKTAESDEPARDTHPTTGTGEA